MLYLFFGCRECGVGAWPELPPPILRLTSLSHKHPPLFWPKPTRLACQGDSSECQGGAQPRNQQMTIPRPRPALPTRSVPAFRKAGASSVPPTLGPASGRREGESPP